jgi:hypothetical protein
LRKERATSPGGEHHDSQQARTTKTISAVDTTTNFTGSKQTRDGFPLRVNDLGLSVDLETTHGIVEDGGHECDVECVVVHAPFTAVEELEGESVREQT